MDFLLDSLNDVPLIYCHCKNVSLPYSVHKRMYTLKLITPPDIGFKILLILISHLPLFIVNYSDIWNSLSLKAKRSPK